MMVSRHQRPSEMVRLPAAGISGYLDGSHATLPLDDLAEEKPLVPVTRTLQLAMRFHA